MLPFAVALSLIAVDSTWADAPAPPPAPSSPPAAPSSAFGPKLGFEASLALHAGNGFLAPAATNQLTPYANGVVDVSALWRPVDAVVISLREAILAGTSGAANVNAATPAQFAVSDAMLAAAWEPAFVARSVGQGGHEAHAVLSAGALAPLGAASFAARSLGGGAAQAGVRWSYRALEKREETLDTGAPWQDPRRTTSPWGVGASVALDGAWHPFTLPRDEQPLLPGRGHPALSFGPLCTGRSVVTLFRYACAPTNLARIGSVVAVEGRFLDDTVHVSASIVHTAAFFPPIANNSALQSQNAASLNYSEATAGALRASWQPLSMLTVGAGVWSSQPPWRIAGLNEGGSTVYEPTIPFWDFFTPANNQSLAFVDVTVAMDMPTP